MTTTVAYLNADEQRTPVTKLDPFPTTDATTDTPIADSFRSVADLSDSTPLPDVPANARWALIDIEDQSVRWRDDGGTPTASVGKLLLPGASLPYPGRLSAFRLIEVTSGAKMTVSYYE